MGEVPNTERRIGLNTQDSRYRQKNCAPQDIKGGVTRENGTITYKGQTGPANIPRTMLSKVTRDPKINHTQ